jgi:Myosin heavy chain
MPKHSSRKKKEKKNGNREDHDEDLLSQRSDYAFGVQNYGEQARKYDAMCMVGKYRLAYESMFLDEITGDLMNHSSYNMTTKCDMSGVGGTVECEREGEGEGERLLDSTNRSNKQSVDQGRMDKSGALDRFNSHDEMSPLVIRTKATLVDTGRSTSHDEMSPWVPKKVAAAKNNDSITTKTTTGTTGTDDSTRVVESKESKSTQHDSIQASKVPTLYEDKESIHVTPKKANTRTKRSGGPFLDKSWQPSPIQPEGSFAIFNDSQAVTLHEYESLAITSSKCGHELTAITTSKGVQTSPESIKTNEQVRSNEDFLKIVAAIVIQTFFRRHLAYKLAWKRYSAALTIQRFLGRMLERKKYREAVMKRTTFHFYDLAATQIQAAWRGWWVRDCLNVETYCACMIQKAFRCYLAQRQYMYDLQRIIVVQSVMRRFLTTVAIGKQTKAATTIQTVWRKSAAKHKYINTLVDILIVQSVCRRFLVLKRIASMNKKNAMPQRQTQKWLGGIISSKDYHPRRPSVQEIDVELNQMNANELILKWESRRR